MVSPISVITYVNLALLLSRSLITASIVDLEFRALFVLTRIISSCELTPSGLASSKVILFSAGVVPLINFSMPPLREIATSTPEGLV